MKLLRIVAVAALTAYGGIFAGAANAAPAAGLPVGASAVRTLATPAPGTSIEKTYYYRRHYWRHRHYWHPYYRPYYRPYYHPYRHPYYW